MWLAALADCTVPEEVAAGEIMTPGRPLIIFAPDSGVWYSFIVHEDHLGVVAVGAPLTLKAADGHSIPARATALLPLGEFATWRAAQAVGDHDPNSFRLRVEPVGAAESLEPGMTVFLPKTPSGRP